MSQLGEERQFMSALHVGTMPIAMPQYTLT